MPIKRYQNFFICTLIAILACAVLAIPALARGAGASAATQRFTITTQNVKVGMSPRKSHHDINQAAEYSSVLFTQEMGLRAAHRFAPRGWGSVHYIGAERGDCATFYNRSVWTLKAHWLDHFTYGSFKHADRYALVSIFKGMGIRLAAVCVHSITHSLQRSAVFNAGMRRLQMLLTNLHARVGVHVIIGGDWNRIWSLRHRFRNMRSFRPASATGPSGGRIDYFEWARGFSATGERIIGHTFSDHNGTRLHLVVR